jgi:hypothetical protein
MRTTCCSENTKAVESSDQEISGDQVMTKQGDVEDFILCATVTVIFGEL